MRATSGANGDRWVSRLGYLLLTALALWLALYLWVSRTWRMTLDAPLMVYVAFLYDRFGLVPYKDVLTMSYPGTHIFHLLVGRALGWGDAGFRLALWGLLAAQGAATWAAMRRFGPRVAAGATLIFSLVLLHGGPAMGLQREAVALLPLTLALATTVAGEGRAQGRRALLIGFCCGLAATIKPHLAIGLPLFLLFLLRGEAAGWPAPRAWLRVGIGAGIGLALPLLLAWGWVWRQGAWPAFLDMTLHYLPLYLRLTGEHVTIAGVNRLIYLLNSFGKLGGLGMWLAPAAVGWVSGWLHGGWGPAQKEQSLLLLGLAGLYSLYPLGSGQFWDYHWLPFQFFIVLVAALCLTPRRAHPLPGRGHALAPLATLLIVLLLALAPTHEFYGQLWDQPPRPPSQGRADAIAAFLRQHLDPEDEVQPLDWTGGAIHGLLQAEARLATRFFYDFYFYHHLSSPVIQGMRRQFLADLAAAPPRFIVEVTQKRRPSGADTTTAFPELRAFLAAHYRLAASGEGYLIYERR